MSAVFHVSLGWVAIALAATSAHAQLAVSANDNKATLDNGANKVVVIHNGSGKAKESPCYNPNGLLLLYRVDGFKLTKVAQAPIGRWSQGIAFSRDGGTILVQNMLERDIQVFRFDGTTLGDTGQRIKLSGGGAAIRTAKF